MKIAVNGAGIAGTTLAYWLHRYGHEPVLFEAAPKLRTGGYVIDFWGVGYEVADRMGLVPNLKKIGYKVGEWRLVNADGHRTGGFSTSVIDHFAGERIVSLERSGLAAAIYETVRDKVETVFRDSIAGIDETTGGVRVAFDHGRPRNFDLVIGADGLHSRVRNLAFGPEDRFETYLGYHVAAFQVDGYRPRDELVYISHTEPGRQISRFSMRDDKTLFLFVFHADEGQKQAPADDAARKAALRDVFGDMGWETPRILEAMQDAQGIYFDRVSQIRMGRWTRGRTALLGDAAACVSLLAGEGTGLAMAEAYILAGELAVAGDNHQLAFARYHERLADFILHKQETAKGLASSFAPETRFGIFVRDLTTRLMAIPLLADVIIGRDLRDDIELPDYGEPSKGQIGRIKA
jgi:2-polyprenyl-6-methoxyphenol hydroxylase-like FAD-dependent oxidoreductase